MNNNIIEDILKYAAQEPIVGYFGYGSLVNKKTLRTTYIASVPATLIGWQRMWDIPNGVNFKGHRASLLTVRPADNKTTKGVIVFDFARNLPLVDAREYNYDRRKLNSHDFQNATEFMTIPCDFYTYEAQQNKESFSYKPPILNSYLDAVLQGFLNVYGESGVEDFIMNTVNFDTPVFQDRNTPHYPRFVNLSPDEKALIDHFLSLRSDISFIS